MAPHGGQESSKEQLHDIDWWLPESEMIFGRSGRRKYRLEVIDAGVAQHKDCGIAEQQHMRCWPAR